MEPSCPITVANFPGLKTFSVEVRTDCGQVFRSTTVFHESNFQDAFSFIMKDAEKRIRDVVAAKQTT